MRNKSTKVKYNKLVPDDSFIGRYLAYMEAQETPYAYDFWTACWLLSLACGRGTVVNRPRAPVHLNLFAILVADSGTTRKSSAIREAIKIARVLTGTAFPLITSKVVPEKFEFDLHKQSAEYGTANAAIAISELVTFLGREKYVEKMPTLLTDLYDCPELMDGGGSISRGTSTLRNVFVSFLSASTPAWLLRAVNPDVIEGGFTSRVVFIVEEQPKKFISWPEKKDGDAELDNLGAMLVEIRDQAQELPKIDVSDGARKTFDKWYKSRYIARDAFRASFQSREDAHILRTAAFLCINDGLWVIQHAHIVTAIRIVTELRENGASIFDGTGSNSRLVLGIDKIRDKLLAAGISGLPQTDLTKACASLINAEAMRTALDVMHDLGMVQRFEGIKVGRGRPTTLWRATQLLGQGKAIDKIIEGHPSA
jgi:hypothetical protein